MSQQSAAEVFNRFSAAYNSHNTEEILTVVSDSVTWFTINGDSMSIDVNGKSNLAQWLRRYFQQCPSCRSEFLSIQEAGRFISVHEKASWKGKNGSRSQKSLGVYEIINGKIVRVWYYPAEQ